MLFENTVLVQRQTSDPRVGWKKTEVNVANRFLLEGEGERTVDIYKQSKPPEIQI